MSTILEKIIATKHAEVALAQQQVSFEAIKKQAKQADLPRNFLSHIQQKLLLKASAVIAEIKKASPSRGLIRENFDVPSIASTYEKHGATCLSILTDQLYFQGHPSYIKQAKADVSLPILRKDFMLSPYQIYESRVMGADAILLIVSALTLSELQELEAIALDLGLSILVEVHNYRELMLALQLKTPLIGINNRNLHTFEVTLQTTFELIPYIPQDRIIVTESGIFTRDDVLEMRKKNVHTFLIGESFMRQPDPGVALADLFSRLV